MAFEYNFAVDTDDDHGIPFGPVSKENMDIARFVVDFSCWLDANELINKIEYARTSIQAPPPVPPWQQDYPLDNTSATQPPSDTYPLGIMDITSPTGTTVELLVNAGTPGLTYAVSFCVSGTTSQRLREVDILVQIDIPLNPLMVTPGDFFPATPPITVTGGGALPHGFDGAVYVNNVTGGPITITMPPSPVEGQTVEIFDIAQNFGQYPLTIIGDINSPYIFGPTQTSFVADITRDHIELQWVGPYWFVSADNFGFLG